jgi:hypothetical protein
MTTKVRLVASERNWAIVERLMVVLLLLLCSWGMLESA